jgi:hypothetical protein
MSPSASPAGKFQCASCGKQFTWKPEIAGRSAKCKCGAIIAIPKSAPPSPAAAPSVAIPSQAINDEQPASDNTAETSDHAGASTLRTIFLLLIGFAAGLAAIVVLGTLAIKAMFPVPPRTAITPGAPAQIAPTSTTPVPIAPPATIPAAPTSSTPDAPANSAALSAPASAAPPSTSPTLASLPLTHAVENIGYGIDARNWKHAMRSNPAAAPTIALIDHFYNAGSPRIDLRSNLIVVELPFDPKRDDLIRIGLDYQSQHPGEIRLFQTPNAKYLVVAMTRHAATQSLFPARPKR